MITILFTLIYSCSVATFAIDFAHHVDVMAPEFLNNILKILTTAIKTKLPNEVRISSSRISQKVLKSELKKSLTFAFCIFN